ncbi:hypothetical protein Hanom_Chr00s077286g01791721 [Helianthus anomalus]
MLYVDRTNVPPINVDRHMSPLEFWTIEKLRKRERIELKNGGFGMGELRDQYVYPKNDTSEHVRENNLNKIMLYDDTSNPVI